MSLFVNNVNEKNITEIQDRRNFESVRAICTRVTTLHLCFMRIYSFSANHKRVFFFFLGTLLRLLIHRQV